MLRALIVEDYPDEAAALKEQLELYGKRHELEFDITWSESAAAVAKGTRGYDVIFLDIELPGMDGMDAARLLRSYDPTTPLIFVTSLSQYAVASYEVNATGFIVKPVTQPKLEMCLDKITGRLNGADDQKIVLTASGGVRAIPIKNLRYVELVRHDLVFHVVDRSEPLRIRGTIRQVLESTSDDGPLFQISSGCVVNFDYVSLIKGAEVQLTDGTVLPLSRARRKNALQAFATYLGSTL